MAWTREIVAALAFAVLFLIVLLIAEVWARRFQPAPEKTRKLVHFLGGLICLAFPYFIASPWAVVALAVALAGLFVVGKRLQFLQCLHSVKRRTRGAEYFPVTVAAVFWLAHDRPWLYVASLLTLAVADALAAIIGSRFGHIRFEVDREHKSVEGSLVFYLASFATIYLPMALSSDTELPLQSERILIALLAAMLVTVFEAIGRHGRDNLWVPLGTLLVLAKAIDESLTTIYLQLASFAAAWVLITIAGIYSRAVNVGATLALILTAYGCWALASIDWALPIFGSILLCFLLARWNPPPQRLRAAEVLHMVMPNVALAGAANIAFLSHAHYTYSFLFGPFLAGAVAVVSQNAWYLTRPQRPSDAVHQILRCLCIVAIALGGVCGPLWFSPVGLTYTSILALFGLGLMTCRVHAMLFDDIPPSTQRQPYLWHRYVLIAAAMALLAGLQLAAFISVCTPR